MEQLLNLVALKEEKVLKTVSNLALMLLELNILHIYILLSYQVMNFLVMWCPLNKYLFPVCNREPGESNAAHINSPYDLNCTQVKGVGGGQ